MGCRPYVGPLAIEFLHERIEASLLLQTVHAGWPRGFVFEGQVHALVAAVLLRVAGPNALDVDAEAQRLDQAVPM